MAEEHVLDLGGVDVGAAGDDHVDLAVAQEQVAVLVEEADVPDGEELADPVALRLLLVLVVLEVAGLHRHVDGADRLRRPRFARRRRRRWRSRRWATACRPCPASSSHSFGGDQGAAAFGGGVVLVDGVAPPVDHLALDVDGARGSGVDHVAEGGHVVAGPRLLREGQQPVELGRHHMGRGHPVALDELEHVLGQPLVHEDDGVAQMDGGSGIPDDGRVVERRADDVDVVVVGLDPEQEEDPRQPEGRLLGGGTAQAAGTRPSGSRSCPRCSS